MKTPNIAALTLVAAATVAATIALPATAHADYHVTCTDTGTGHYFRMSQESNELG